MDASGRQRKHIIGIAFIMALAIVSIRGTAAATPAHGGTLTWIVTPEPASIVPLTTTAGGNAELGPKVVEGLLTYDKDLNPKPLLATAWSVSKDGLQYRFTLRHGVRWHDGQAFTSADVAFSILTLKDVHPRGRSTFANVTAVTTPDPYTAVIQLSRPAPFLLTALSGSESPIVPKRLYEGTDIVSNPHNSAPIGTGPFVFKSFVRGNYIELERNPDYWDKPKPFVDKIVVRFIPDGAARAAALESGVANLGDQAIPLSDVKRFAALPDSSVDSRNWPYVSNHQQLVFNLDTPVLKDKAVRKAISQAVDVNALNRIVWYGYGTVSAAAIGVANTKFHDADVHYFPYDIAQANSTLDSLGLKRGPDGKRFRLRLLYNPFQDPRAADFIRQSLARIGIDAEIQTYDFATYVTIRIARSTSRWRRCRTRSIRPSACSACSGRRTSGSASRSQMPRIIRTPKSTVCWKRHPSRRTQQSAVNSSSNSSRSFTTTYRQSSSVRIPTSPSFQRR